MANFYKIESCSFAQKVHCEMCSISQPLTTFYFFVRFSTFQGSCDENMLEMKMTDDWATAEINIFIEVAQKFFIYYA